MIKNFENFNNNTLGINKTKKRRINSHSTPITNNAQILQALVDYQQMAYRNKEKSLLRNLVDDLYNFFGDPNRNFLSGRKLWTLEYDNLIFDIFTKEGEGTKIEIHGYSYSQINNGIKLDEILDFLETLYALINNKSTEELKLRKQAKKYNL